jgi:PAS domain S-box-containing protein
MGEADKTTSEQEARARLAAIVESTDDAVIGKTLTGIITSWNRGAEKCYGYRADEVLGRHVSLLVPPERLSELTDIMVRISRGEHLEHLETVRITKDGRRINVSLTVSPIYGEKGAIIGASTIARDVTGRTQLENRLRESEKRYQVLIELAADAIVVLEQGHFVYANCAALGLYGADSLEQLQQHTVLDLVHPDERAAVKDRYWLLLGGEANARRECRLLRLDGQEVAVETSSVALEYQGKPAIQVIARDVSLRKRAEAERENLLNELEFQRTRFETVLRQMPVGIMIAEAPSGRISYHNKASETIFGARLPVVESMAEYFKWQAFNLEGAPLEVEQFPIRRALVLGELVIGEQLQFARGDGSRGFVSINAAPILGPEGNIISAVAAFTDITEQITASRALRQSEERLNLTLDATGMGSCYIGARTGTGIWNQQHFRLLGYPVPESLSGPASLELWYQRVHPEDLPKVVGALETARTGHSQFRCEHRIRRADDGRETWVDVLGRFSYDAQGAPEAFIGVIFDVSERKTAEAALRASEARFRWLFDSNLVAIFFWREDGTITDANQAYCELIGVSPRECQAGGLNWIESTPEQYRLRDQEAVREIKEQGMCKPYEKEFLNLADGRRVPVLCAGALVPGADSDGMGFAIDLTELKRAETALKDEVAEKLQAIEYLHRQEQILIRQARFAALGEMIGNIAHQWRQPLNTLALIVQELNWYYEHHKFSREYLADSVARSMQVINHMSKTIDGFRNFFEPSKELIDFPVGVVVTQTAAMLEAAFNELRIEIELHAEPELMVHGSPNEFSQVVLNILVNAKDALVERKPQQPRVTLRLYRERGRVVLTISDNAGGIAPEIIDKVFDPYFTTKGPDRGSGIGLFMSKTIIEKNMQGTLSVRNTETGAEFRIEV